MQLWHIHNAEQMILDHEEENPDEYKDKKFEETVDPSFDEENSVEYTKAYYKDALLPKMILVMGLLYYENSLCLLKTFFFFNYTNSSSDSTVAIAHQKLIKSSKPYLI